MKKFVIIYSIISIILFIVVYLGTLLTTETSRSATFYKELTSEVAKTKDIYKLVEYQITAYKKIDSHLNDDFYCETYHVIYETSKEFYNQIVLYVIPINLKLAEASQDENDEMDIVYDATNDTSNYSFKEIYGSSISYLAKSDGIIFFAKTVNSADDINVQFIDYDGITIFEKEFHINPIERDDLPSDSSFTNGLTAKERYEVSGIRDFQRKHLLITIPIFLVMDVLVGVGVYFLRKRKG